MDEEKKPSLEEYITFKIEDPEKIKKELMKYKVRPTYEYSNKKKYKICG